MNPEPARQFTDRGVLALMHLPDLLEQLHPGPLRHDPTVQGHPSPVVDPPGGAKSHEHESPSWARSGEHTHPLIRVATAPDGDALAKLLRVAFDAHRWSYQPEAWRFTTATVLLPLHVASTSSSRRAAKCDRDASCRR